MTGDVLMDKDSDREPDYWLWQFGPTVDTFVHWTDIKMTNPSGQVCNGECLSHYIYI